MIKIIPIDVTSLKIAVTSTATKLFTLMDTAGSLAAETNGNYYTRDKKANALLITPEDGDVRILPGADPTATVGSLLKSGTMYYFPNVNLTELRLIRTSGSNVNCSVEICISEPSEASFAVASGGSASITSVVPGTGATNLGKAEDAAHTSGDVGVMALGVRKDTAASLAGTDGDYTAPIFNSTGHQHMAEGFASQAEDNTLGAIYTLEKPTSSSTNAVTLDTSSAAEASSVTKASAGRLYGFVFSNGNGATRYLQFFNSTTVPADATVPFLVFRVATGETLHWEFNKGIPFSTGISWCNSSTQNTKTIGSADSLANIFYA